MTKPALTNAERQARQRQYLSRMFALHPVWQTSQLLELRRKALGIKPVVKSAALVAQDNAQLSVLRQQVDEKIKKIQAEFWAMPLDRLQNSLRTLPVNRLPEHKPVVNRLRLAASCRGQFPVLTQAKAMDLKLLNAFRAAVVLPPAEAGFERERFIQSIRNGKRLRSVKAAVKYLRDEHPELYRMESDWFENILQLKKPRREDSRSEYQASTTFTFPEFGWGTWILILFVIRIILRLLMSG